MKNSILILVFGIFGIINPALCNLNDLENSSSETAFGEAIAVPLTPWLQIKFPYNINSYQVSSTVTGIGTVSQSLSLASVQSGASVNSGLVLESVLPTPYRTGQGVQARFTAIFSPCKIGNIQAIGLFDLIDGFWVGCNGNQFGISRRSSGVDNFIAQSDWSEDKLDGYGKSKMLLDITKGNVYSIKYQWLGFGMQIFSIEDQRTGKLVPFHKISYANQNTSVSVNDPSFLLRVESTNTSNNTNVTIKTASMATFVEGILAPTGMKWSADGYKASVGATAYPIFTIRNKASFLGNVNRLPLRLDDLVFSTDGTKVGRMFLGQDCTLNSANYVDLDTNKSVVDVDTTSTTLTGCRILKTAYIGKTGNLIFPLWAENILLPPGHTLSVGAVTQSSGTNDYGASISWEGLW